MKNKNKFNRLLIALPTLLLLATTGVHAGNDAHSGKTTRVSVSSKGAQGDSPSSSNAISADGRYVAFTSDATNLVAGDTNGVSDAFVRDRKTGKTTRISVSSGGKQANSPGLFGSSSRAISADGRYVAFISYATNLVTGDTNGVPDVFVRDRKTGKTTRVSSAGEQPQCSSDNAVISADGRYVAFRCGIAGTWVYLHDRKTGETTYISGDDVNLGAISADGRYVTYGAFGLCLKLPGAHLDSIGRAGVYDRVTGMKTTVSGGNCGSHSYPRAISAGGRYVAVQSDADNLVAGDTNNANDAFVHDRKTGETTRVSVSSASAEGNAGSYPTAISTNGRYVVFESDADNLVAGDTNGVRDAFVYDRKTGKTKRVSVGSRGKQGNKASSSSAISANGRYVAFSSDADNLVARDTNGVSDVFVRDRRNHRDCGDHGNHGDGGDHRDHGDCGDHRDHGDHDDQ